MQSYSEFSPAFFAHPPGNSPKEPGFWNIIMKTILYLALCVWTILPAHSYAQTGAAPLRVEPKPALKVYRGNSIVLHLDTNSAKTVAAMSEAEFRNITLFLNGVPFPKLPCTFSSPNHLAFRLPYDSNASALLRLAMGGHPTAPEIVVDAGIGRTTQQYANTQPVQMVLYEQWQSVVAGIVVVLIAVLLLWLGAKYDIFRDPPTASGSTPTYSLALIQMGIWFLVIFGSYLYIVVHTGTTAGIINGTALILMGISAGVPLTNRMADTSRTGAQTPSLPTSGSLWFDILSDGQQMQLHRLQQIIWTVSFAVLYSVSVVRTLILPDYDPTTLTLMGISLGVYVALRQTSE